MRRNIIGIITILIVLSNMFIGCDPKDKVAPTIILLGVNGNALKYDPNKELANGQNDTTILIHTVYKDPGVYVEDNKYMEEDLTITSNIKEIFTDKNNGYARRVGNYTIEYSAVDPDGNGSKAKRFITVQNLSNFISKNDNAMFSVTSKSTNSVNDTTYRSPIRKNATRAGGVNFPYAYTRKEDGVVTRYNVLGYLFSNNPDYSKTLDPTNNNIVGYMGTAGEPSKAFYESMTYEQAIEYIYDFDYIKIETQTFTNNEGNTVTIRGINENGGLPKSRVVYDKDASSIISITLHFSVEEVGGSKIDIVEETYTPLFEEYTE